MRVGCWPWFTTVLWLLAACPQVVPAMGLQARARHGSAADSQQDPSSSHAAVISWEATADKEGKAGVGPPSMRRSGQDTRCQLVVAEDGY